MGFDLKRTYFGLASFVVLMVAFVAGLMLTSGVSSLVVLAPVPFTDRVPPGYTAAAYGVAIAPAPEVTGTVTPVPGQIKPPPPAVVGPIDDWELRNAREQTAASLATLLVALPIWAFHWRRFQRLVSDERAYLLYRVYAYAAMVVTLVTMIVTGADVLRQPLLMLVGALDLSTRYAQLSLLRGVLGSALGLVWATVVWWFHWRVVETVLKA